jgi:putative transposase
MRVLMGDAEHDVLARLSFPKEHWQRLYSINPPERLNGDIKRRTDVVAIVLNEAAIVCLVGALPLEQNDEGATRRARYISLETLFQFNTTP